MQNKTPSKPIAIHRNINVRRVPIPVWERARLNAIKSHLPFRDFCIRTLAESVAFSTDESPTEEAGDLATDTQTAAETETPSTSQ